MELKEQFIFMYTQLEEKEKQDIMMTMQSLKATQKKIKKVDPSKNARQN